MSTVGHVNVNCPLCGYIVNVAVQLAQVDHIYVDHTGKSHMSVVFHRGDGEHVCGPGGDGKHPIERFVESGALDDHTIR
jgi:hypothetical protein